MTKAAKKKYLRSRGWHEHLGWWYDRPNPKKTGCGLTLDNAVRVATRRDAELDEKTGLKDGTVEVRCNKCGKSCRITDGVDFVGYYGLIKASFSTGYFSPKLPDGCVYKFSMCEHCLDKLMKTFIIDPEKETYF